MFANHVSAVMNPGLAIYLSIDGSQTRSCHVFSLTLHASLFLSICLTCRSVQLPVIQELYNSNLRTIEASQCYGHLSQYLDPSQIPWQDRLVRAGESLPAWEPVAGAWRALHDKCRSITVEVCHCQYVMISRLYIALSS